MEDISVQELKDRLNKGEQIAIIDVREPYEYEEYNIGAKLIPLGNLKDELPQLNAFKSQELIVHCKSGNRSAAAKVFLEQNGFQFVRSLTGGMVAYQALN
jgi:rhodanese-related sulfurtransferase